MIDATRARPASSTACAAATWTTSTAASARCGYQRCSPYHAGLTSDDRRETQEAFAAETVRHRRRHRRLRHGHRPVERPLRAAHRHAEVARALPAGDRPRRPRRAEAECVLLYSGGDVIVLEDHRANRPRKPRHRARVLPGRASRAPRRHGDRYCRGPSAGTARWSSTSASATRPGNCRAATSAWATPSASPTPRSSRRRSSRAWPASRSASASTTSSTCSAARTPSHSFARPRQALDLRPAQGSAEGRSARLGLSAHRSGRAGAGRGRIPGPEAERGVVGSHEGPAFRCDSSAWHRKARPPLAHASRRHCQRGPTPRSSRNSASSGGGGGPQPGFSPYQVFPIGARGTGPRPADDRGSAAAGFGRGPIQPSIVRPLFLDAVRALLPANWPGRRCSASQDQRPARGAENGHAVGGEVAGVRALS